MASIRDRLDSAPDGPERFLWGASASVCLGDFRNATSLGGRVAELAGRSVLIATQDQFAAALALIELDGFARRLIVCPPDLPSEHLPALVAKAGVDAIVSDHDTELFQNLEFRIQTTLSKEFHIPNSKFQIPTEWVLLTSGTTGAPKMLVHSFASLTAPINNAREGREGQEGRDGRDGQEGPKLHGADVVWGTFYDIRRYGGLQIFFRAVLGRGSFVLSGAGEPIGEFLVRLGAHGATHVSGTPSHWRRALMSPDARAITPRYIRLSGEIADQAILNALRSVYPQASIGHAFASTEAGVGFEVNDGLEGFPASMVGASGDVQLKVDDGSLRIRSARTAVGYVGEDHSRVADDEGFVDTGDMVERRGDRYYFLGRRSGIINVGGLKVYPEEVEAAINRHPAVRMSMVRSARSPITGSLVAADVVLKGERHPGGAGARIVDFKREILQICHDNLAPHKIPATIRFVQALEIADAGKLARHA
jgi:acyl-CoA synthetase (AMP-forming)/AMP-acid ligase II